MTANELKIGMVIKLQGELFKVVKTEHVKPGKGGAFIQAKFKNIKKAQNVEKLLRVEEKVEQVVVREVPGVFIYKQQDSYYFMNVNSCEEVVVSEELITHPQLLTEQMEVELYYSEDDNELLRVALPKVVCCKIQSTSGCVKGGGSSQYKQALLTNGLTVKIPQYLVDDKLIDIDSVTLDFIKCH